ncbi:hypothetical protein OIU85_028255 [Salix viminalis]|uniref:Uncharacterized protein n=1 Tax=Salix viminalis TaxID=40686 RepID=A0A9Q0QKC4_SALVM|nr:hypothetical protein OIU85_028255 [Salix viminalis]
MSTHSPWIFQRPIPIAHSTYQLKRNRYIPLNDFPEMPLDMNTGYPKKRKGRTQNEKKQETISKITERRATILDTMLNVHLHHPHQPQPLLTYHSSILPITTLYSTSFPVRSPKSTVPMHPSKAINLWDNNKMYGKSKESQNGS